MPKLYEHQITNGDHAETISIETIAKSIRIAVGDIADMDSEEETEQITSIDLTPDGVAVFIEALLHSINEDDYVVLKLTGTDLKQIIESMELSVEVLKCEVNQADMPYGLIKMLKYQFEDLLQRDKAKKDA